MSCSIIRNKDTKEIERVNAPNGKESILYNSVLEMNSDKEEALRIWAQVYTPSFKQWFGDWENDKENSSKVVDDNGEPLVVYHGSEHNFEEFNLKYFGRQDVGDRGYGFYFSKSKDIAEGYGEEVYPVFLNIKNPYNVKFKDNDPAFYFNRGHFSNYKDEIDKNELDRANWLLKVENNDIGYAFFDGLKSKSASKSELVDYVNNKIDQRSKNFSERLKELSIIEKSDGVINDDYEIVVSSPNQIKSVTNQGTFSKENNNIYLQTENLHPSQQEAKDILYNEVYDRTLYPGDIDRINRRLKQISDRVGDITWRLAKSRVNNWYVAGYNNSDVTRGNYFSQLANGLFSQTNDVVASKSSPETLGKIKEVAQKMGIKIQALSDYLKGNPNVTVKGINGLADTIKSIVAIAEGKEDVALTEEVIHVATAIMEQTSPNVITEMISKIDRFNIYKKTLEAYKDNKNYQLPNGKPDIRKIKKEAVDKLLTEMFIHNNEGDTEFPELKEEANRSILRTWWNKILDFIRGQYKKTNIDIFNEAESKIINQTNIQNESRRISSRTDENLQGTGETGINLEGVVIPKSFTVLWKDSPDGSAKRINLWGTWNSTPNRGMVSSISNMQGYILHSPTYQQVKGKSIREIFQGETILGKELVGMERNIFYQTILSLRIAQSLFGNQFNRGIANKLKLDRIIFVDIPDGHPMYINKEGFHVNINEKDGFLKSILEVTSPNNEGAYIDMAIAEELIHLVSSRLTSTELQKAAYLELTQKNKNDIKRAYYNKQDTSTYKDLTEFQYVHEYVRMKIQDKIFHKTTENIKDHLNSIINQVWEFIKDLIPAYKSMLDVYNKTLNFIEKGEGELQENSSEEILGLPSLEQSSVQKSLAMTDATLRKIEAKEPIDVHLLETDEPNNWYEILNDKGVWEKVKNRVTDRVKAWYKKQFPNKSFTPEEEKFNEFKRTLGIKYHSFMEEIHGRYFNKDGTRKTSIGDRVLKLGNTDNTIYNGLESYFSDLIKEFPTDSLVFSEVKVYDPKEKEAGTLDLLVVDKDGKGHIFDWKFMSVSKKSQDIAWYKKGAYNIQLGRYKDILLKRYNIKSIGMNRAIPILMNIVTDESTGDPVLTGINIGSIDVSKITDLRLLPFSEKSESTTNDKLDKVVTKLSGMLSTISSQKVKEEDRQFKNDRLNLIEKAIRYAQTKHDLSPLIATVSKIKQEGTNILDDWNTTWKNRNVRDANNQEKSEFAEKMHDYRDVALTFEEIEFSLRKVIYDKDEAAKATTDEEKEDWEFRKGVANNLREEVESIIESRREIEEVSKEFTNKFLGWVNNVTGLLTAEKILRGLGATFYNISMLPNASLQVLNKLVTDATITANRNALTRVNRLLELKNELSKSGNLRDAINLLYQKDDKGKNMNKLFYKYDHDFYKEVNKNALLEKPSMKWIEDNIDIEAYKKAAQERIDKGVKRYKLEYKHDEDTANKFIEDLSRKWDITRKDFNGWDNDLIKKFPIDKWLSKEYIEIQKNKPLLELYTLIHEVNHEAASIGYIEKKVINTFLPFIRKGFAEKVAWRENPLEMMNWERSLRVNPEDTGFGKINEMNGNYEHSVPKYFTYDFTRDGEKASEDVFKNLMLYFSHVEKYRELINLEGQIKILQDVEQMKDHIETNMFGMVQKEKGKALVSKGNEFNSKVLNKFVRTLFYGEKYVDTDTDIAINVHPQEAMKKMINFVAGHEVYKVDENPDPISLTKTIDALNQYFRVKTLGGNVVSGAAVFFGSSMQVMSQAGRYFTATEFSKNLGKSFRNYASGPNKEMWLQLVEHFLPLREDAINAKLEKAGMTTLTNINLKDKLMSVMSLPSEHVEQSIFLSLLQNSMVDENGKIINIRQYVKNKYKDRYSSTEKYKQALPQIENEIAELQNTRSIDATKKLVDGKLVIPGLDLSNTEELNRLTKLTRRIAETSTHGRTASDANQSAMNIWLNSMMVFKTWMPKLIKTRFDVLSKVSDDFSVVVDDEGNTMGERYDVGRIRLFMHTMGFNIFKGTMRIYNILSMNKEGLNTLDDMFSEYAKEYENRTGQEFTMSKEDFFDMVRDNLRNEARELSALLLLTGAVFSLGFIAPGDDKDKAAKNSMAYFHKVLDKFHSQLEMFYDPREWSSVLTGGIFPALGIFSDIGRFIQHSFLEITGLDVRHPLMDRDEVLKKAQPLKYSLELFPMGKAFITYMSMIDAEFAKDFNVAVSPENRR